MEKENLKSEGVVLSGIMGDKKNLLLAIERGFLPEHLTGKYRTIYDKVLELFNSGKPIDYPALAEALRNKISTSQLAELTEYEYYLTDISYHIDQLIDTATRRGVAAALQKAATQINDPDKTTQETIAELCQKIIKPTLTEDEHPADTILKRLDENIEQPKPISTGFFFLDKHISGLLPGALIIIGGRSSIGKTTYATDIFWHVTKTQKQPALWVGLEARKEETYLYTLQKWTSVHPLQITQNNISADNRIILKEAVQDSKKFPMFFEDSCFTLTEISLKIRQAVMSRGIKVVFIDYLQLISNSIKGESRQVQVAAISRELKRLAMQLDITIVALAQLNKDAETRGQSRLADIRESEAISHDADVVLFLNRPTFYAPDKDDPDFIEIAKNRHGLRGKCTVEWLQKSNRYIEWDEQDVLNDRYN